MIGTAITPGLRRARSLVALSLVGVLALTGCGRAASQRTVTVLAASSLHKPFEELAHDFESAHPGVTVRLVTGGSSALAAQIDQGSPADVFASAGESQMRTARTSGRVGDPTVFARNTLTLVVPRGNPGHVTRLADLTRPGASLAVCQPQVPCGQLATRALAGLHPGVRPTTEEPDVSAVLTKVRVGEVDAGLVYVTDAASAGSDVTQFPLGPSAPSTSYPIATLTDAADPALASGFRDLVVSAQGRRVLAAAGFQAP